MLRKILFVNDLTIKILHHFDYDLCLNHYLSVLKLHHLMAPHKSNTDKQVQHMKTPVKDWC